MKKLVILFIFSGLILSTVFAQENPLNSLIEDIYEKDQFARKKLVEFIQEQVADSIVFYNDLVAKVDEENRRAILGILDAEGWPEDLSEKANEAIFLVIQHAAHEDRLKYADLVKSQADKGKIKQKDYALLYDRILMGKGHKQMYGSQMVQKMKDGNPVSYVWPVEDPENIDEIRLSVGLLPFDLYSEVVKKHTGQIVIWDKNLTIEQLESLPDLKIIAE